MMQPPPRKSTKAVVVLRAVHHEHLTRLQAKHQQECDLLEDLRNFTKQRSLIEKTYAEAILKLSTSFLQKKIPTISEIKSDDGQERRTVYTLWRSLLDENEKLAKARLAAAEVFHHEISESCKAIKANKVHAAKKCFDQLQKIHEEVQLSARDLDKAKKIYFEDEHIAHDAREKAHDAEEKLKRKKGNLFQSISSLQKNSAKFSSKKETCDIKSMFSRNEYLLQLAAINAHQNRYFETDLPQVIKTLDSETYEKVTDFIQLLSRTELLTCAATQASYNKIINMAELDRKNTRQYNLECFLNEHPVLKDSIAYQFEPCEGDQIDFITNDHNASLALSKEARKWAARIHKENRAIRENNKQLREALSQMPQGQRYDPNDQSILDLEQKIDDLKQSIRKSETNKFKAEAKIESLRNAGVNVSEWIQNTDSEVLNPMDASSFNISRSGSLLSVKTDISGNIEDVSSEVGNDSFYDSDFNDAASDISGGIATVAMTSTVVMVAQPPEPVEPLPAVVEVEKEEQPSTVLVNGNETAEIIVNEQPNESYGVISAVALYNYEAQNADELSIMENEQLEIIGEGDGDGWIKARNYQGVEGFIPQNYVEIEGEEAVLSCIQPAPVSFSSVDYQVPVSQTPVALTLDLPNTSGPKHEMCCRALYDYEATCPEELSFEEGQIIHILRKEVCDVDDGWWEGEIDGRIGLFPSLVVEELDGSDVASPQDLESPPCSAPPTFSPPAMPQYLLPPAQVIITQPTPVSEHPNDQETFSVPTESYSHQTSGFEMELSEAQHVQYHGQFSSSDSEINVGEDSTAYSQLVSSPDSPSSSPIMDKFQPVKDEAEITTEEIIVTHVNDIDQIPSSSEIQPEEDALVTRDEEMDAELEAEPCNDKAEGKNNLETSETADVISVDSVLTDPGSSPSNATGDNSIDTVVDLNLNTLQETKESDGEVAQVKNNGTDVENQMDAITDDEQLDSEIASANLPSIEIETIQLNLNKETN